LQHEQLNYSTRAAECTCSSCSNSVGVSAASLISYA
jgi:hypothetical protein